MANKRKQAESADAGNRSGERAAEVRIIGGTFRGRRLIYHGDPVVRPMKHRTREAIFNLISTECTGRHAIDLFAGTGALGLEALSRGAASATFIEKHVPSARIVQENIRTLGVDDRTTLLVTSAFLWMKRDLNETTSSNHADRPWVVFCSPPYSFFHERQAEMVDLIERLQLHAPADSIIIIEADEPFDFALLRDLRGAATAPPGTCALTHRLRSAFGETEPTPAASARRRGGQQFQRGRASLVDLFHFALTRRLIGPPADEARAVAEAAAREMVVLDFNDEFWLERLPLR